MRIGSLFSGIGGLELGLELALGGRVVWQVEREPWPRAVLARHWPKADRSVTDVCEAGAANLAPVDLVCGGFPCQDISPAGSGKGIEHGEKSGLWREYARILRELRPRYVVVENSAALPSRGLDVVLGDLAALRYHAEWARIGACDVGAPHRRWRCFVVAWLPDAVGLGCRRGAESGHRQLGPHGEARQLADPDSKRSRWGSKIAGRHFLDRPHGRRSQASSRTCKCDTAGRAPVADAHGRGRLGERVEVAADLQGAQRHEPDRCSAPVADTDVDGLHQPEVDEVRTRRHEPIVRAEQRGATMADADSIGFEGVERPGSAARPAIGGSAPSRGGTTGRDPVPSPSVRGVAHGVPGWLGDGPMPRAIEGPNLKTDGRAALRALGNAVVPAVAYEVGLWLRAIMDREGLH